MWVAIARHRLKTRPSQLEKTRSCGDRLRFNGDNAWLSQSFIAACRSGMRRVRTEPGEDSLGCSATALDEKHEVTAFCTEKRPDRRIGAFVSAASG